jgi:hypothetical protein
MHTAQMHLYKTLDAARKSTVTKSQSVVVWGGEWWKEEW